MNTIQPLPSNRGSTTGISGPGSKFISRDANSRNQDHHDVHLNTYEQIRAIIGLIIYVTIFIIIIPITLYKLGYIKFLKLYFLNTDLLATVISYDKGIFKNIFKYIYNDTGPLIGFLSQTLINWTVLMGLFYLIITESRKKPVNDALSKVGFMLFITYLLPSRFIIKLQEWFYNYSRVKITYHNIDINGIFTMLFGLVLVILVIGFEDLIIKYFSNSAKKLLNYIFKVIK